MSQFLAKIPREVRLRAHALGEEGAKWISSLDELAARFESDWELEFGAVLAGGTEALVVAARLRDGREVVLKLGLPGSADIGAEVKAYELCNGNGYASLIQYDLEANALLLEKLDASLATENRAIETQIRVITETLMPSWIKLESAQGLMTGKEKAEWLANFIETQWQENNKPCPRSVVHRALDFCAERTDAFSFDDAYLVHGDAHPHNVLAVPNSGDYRLVDPDGLCAEKACDLAVPMREWSEDLLDGNTARQARQRCDLLATLSGAPERAIWQWGYMERISTALVLKSIDQDKEAELMFVVAEQLNEQPD